MPKEMGNGVVGGGSTGYIFSSIPSPGGMHCRCLPLWSNTVVLLRNTINNIFYSNAKHSCVLYLLYFHYICLFLPFI